jgi:hypothetical protein
MWSKFKRLFIIKTRFEVFVITYALALGACERGLHYLDQYPGFGGWLLFGACNAAVIMASAMMLDAIRKPKIDAADRRQLDRRTADRRSAIRTGSRLRPATQ